MILPVGNGVLIEMLEPTPEGIEWQPGIARVLAIGEHAYTVPPVGSLVIVGEPIHLLAHFGRPPFRALVTSSQVLALVTPDSPLDQAEVPA